MYLFVCVLVGVVLWSPHKPLNVCT